MGALHTLAHSQHITYPVTDVSGLSCRAQLRSTRLVWQALEMGGPDPLDADRREAEEEILALPEDVPYPCEHVHTIANVHTGNVICCRYNSDGSLIATGSSDRSIRIIDVSTCKPVRQLALHTAPVLCVLFCPTHRCLLLSTAMDGTVVLSNAETGCIYHESKNHTKYAHRAVWSPCGSMFATLGHDKSIYVYKVSGMHSEALPAADAAGEGVGSGDQDEFGMTVEVIRKKDLVNIPEAACFLEDSSTLVLSIRGDNYFHYLNVSTGEVQKVNMNQLGDDHVSFTVLDLVLSPSGTLLLARYVWCCAGGL